MKTLETDQIFSFQSETCNRQLSLCKIILSLNLLKPPTIFLKQLNFNVKLAFLQFSQCF